MHVVHTCSTRGTHAQYTWYTCITHVQYTRYTRAVHAVHTCSTRSTHNFTFSAAYFGETILQISIKFGIPKMLHYYDDVCTISRLFDGIALFALFIIIILYISGMDPWGTGVRTPNVRAVA